MLEFYMPEVKCVHMLDDFFIMAASKETCAQHLTALQQICADIGVPLAPDKTTEPATCTAFLGIELDSVGRLAKLPKDKLNQYSDDIRQALTHKKLTRHDLESLIGKLSFAAAVVPARPFLRRLIDLLKQAHRPYHYIRLTKEVKRDLETWLNFLNKYNGITYFRALKYVDSTTIHMSSDASHMGFGACYGSKWLQAKFPPSWQQYHITILELFPIFVLISMFGRLMRNANIMFHCDNEAVTAIINKQSSKDPIIMNIMRPLILQLVEHNINLRSKHIPGVLNILPDKISRFQVTQQLLDENDIDPLPTALPQHLQPRNFEGL